MTLLLESDAFAVELEAGFEVLLTEFAIGLRELGVLEVLEIAESALERVFGGVLGSDAAPEEPLGVSEILDQGTGGGSFGVEFGEEAGEEISEVFLALAGDDEFLGSAAVGGGVIGRMGFSCRGGRSGLKMHRKPRFA